MQKRPRILGGISFFFAVVFWLAKDMLGSMFGDFVIGLLPGSTGLFISQAVVPYLPAVLFAALGVMAIMGWGAKTTVHLSRPNFRNTSKNSEAVSIGDLPMRSSFCVEIENNANTLGEYEWICSITLKNSESYDLYEKCLVKIEQMDIPCPDGMPLPLVLRTDGQIRGHRSGRFSLSSNEHKTVPVLFRNQKRKNEWFFFDERGKHYFVPANSLNMVAGFYGGQSNSKALIEVTVGDDWSTLSTIKEVSDDYALEYRVPKRQHDSPIHTAVDYIATIIDDCNDNDCYPAARHALRRAAFDGNITLCGKRELKDGHCSKLQSPIPQEFWKDQELNFLATSDAYIHHDHTQPEIGEGFNKLGRDREKYSDIRVSMNEIKRIWR